MGDFKFREVCISAKTVFKGKILNLRVDTVRLPNGKEATREVVEHARAVTILALTEDKEVVLTRQFRYPVGEELWELPAGKVDPVAELSGLQRNYVSERGNSGRRLPLEEA